MPNQTFSEELYDDAALKEAVDRMANLIKTHATKAYVDSAVEEKQNKLTFDSTPTASSTNPVTSGGVKTALDAKQDTLIFDNEPTYASENMVSSGAVYEAVSELKENLTESVGDLKSALSELYRTDNLKNKYKIGQFIPLNVGIGNTVNVSSPTTNNNVAFVVYPCKAGDIFTVTGHGGSGSRLWGFTDNNYKLLEVANAEATETSKVLTADAEGYFISNVEYQNATGYDLTVWHEIAVKDYIETFNKLVVTNSTGKAISGVTSVYASDNQINLYGDPTTIGYFATFNTKLEVSNSGAAVPSKTIPSGTYTLYWDNPLIQFYYTTGAYSAGAVISCGVPFAVPFDFAIFITTTAAISSYGTSSNPTTCKFTLFDGAVDANVMPELNTGIDILARLTASAKTERGYYSLNRYLIKYGYINTNVATGAEVSYSIIPNASFGCMAIPVHSGDILKISGSGGNNSRLWAFVDETNHLISKSTADYSISNLILVAPADGTFIFNSAIVAAAIPQPDVNKKAYGTTDVYENALMQAEYDYRHKGFDILSAFSNVSCFGDSLTASVVYTHENQDHSYEVRSAYKKYPQILGNKIGAEWESVATGGYSATDWWGAYANRIVSKTNQLCVVYLGTNGGLTDTIETDAPGDDYTQYANTNTGNYCKIVAKALSVGAKVLLIKIHQGGGDSVFVTNDVIDKVATKYNVAVVDVPFLEGLKYHAFPDGTGFNTLHYNDLGYSAFSDSLIRQVGYLPDEIAVRLIPV